MNNGEPIQHALILIVYYQAENKPKQGGTIMIKYRDLRSFSGSIGTACLHGFWTRFGLRPILPTGVCSSVFFYKENFLFLVTCATTLSWPHRHLFSPLWSVLLSYRIIRFQQFPF